MSNKIVESRESLSTMSRWKFRIFAKKGKRSYTGSKKARLYIAIPPISGWPGGAPESNGFRRSSTK